MSSDAPRPSSPLEAGREGRSLRSAALRAVVIDDQPAIRQALAALLEEEPDIYVVGSAQNGEEGLRVVFQTQPDVILLDLEMPRMDGFAFLRLLMSKRPTPVVVVSSNSTRESVFRALELGALEFVAKPTGPSSAAELGGGFDVSDIREELLSKVRLARRLQVVTLVERTREHRERMASALLPAEQRRARERPAADVAPERLLCIGASTGGPAAILSLLLALDDALPVGVLITQHMPENFTHAFAERLARATRWPVQEAAEGALLRCGEVLVASGRFSLRIAREGKGPHTSSALGAQSLLRVLPPPRAPQPLESRANGFVPSVDRMLEAAALAMGGAVIAVILTGMSGEGVRGAQAVRAAGGVVLVEDPGSAVLSGMPEEVIRAGAADEVLPLTRMADAITRLVQRRGV